MPIDDTVKQLFDQYFTLKGTRRSFESDSSPNNREARNGILDHTGTPAYELEAGSANTLLSMREAENLQEISQHATRDTYAEFKGEFYDTMSDEGQAAAYATLIEEDPHIRSGVKVEALKRVATKHNLDEKLSENDPGFRNKPETDKLKAYEKAVNKDKGMLKDLNEDAAFRAANALELADAIDSYLMRNKPEDAVDLIDQALGVKMASLYRNAGQTANVKALAEKIRDKQREYAVDLMVKNGYVASSVEAAVDRVPHGYAKAAAEVYAAYSGEGENKFRGAYQKAKDAHEVDNLDAFRAKLREKTKKALLKKAA